jgi:regulator of protease activity HflC (stomatin/prohibitin superfamily)
MVNKLFVGAFAGACLLVFLIVFPLSFNYIPPNYVGIKYNKNTKSVDYDATYQEGRYFMGPSVNFFLFPLTVTTIELKVTARASDAYPLSLKFAFQYRLDPEHIIQLYKTHSKGYENVFRRIAREAVMKAIGNYASAGFYRERQKIIDELYELICAKLKDNFATCWGLQFTEVDLAAQLEKKLLMMEIDRWYVKKKNAEQLISKVVSITDVVEADFQKNISIVRSNSSAEQLIIKKQSESEARLITKEAEANATIAERQAEAKAALIEKNAQIEKADIDNKAAAEAALIEKQAKAEATLLEEEAQANASKTMSEADAKASMIIKKAEGEANQKLVYAEGKALQYLKDKISLSPAGLVRYQKLLMADKYNEANMVFGFSNSLAIHGDGDSARQLKTDLQLEMNVGSTSGRRLTADDVASEERRLKSFDGIQVEPKEPHHNAPEL